MLTTAHFTLQSNFLRKLVCIRTTFLMKSLSLQHELQASPCSLSVSTDGLRLPIIQTHMHHSLQSINSNSPSIRLLSVNIGLRLPRIQTYIAENFVLYCAPPLFLLVILRKGDGIFLKDMHENILYQGFHLAEASSVGRANILRGCKEICLFL